MEIPLSRARAIEPENIIALKNQPFKKNTDKTVFLIANICLAIFQRQIALYSMVGWLIVTINFPPYI